MTEMSSADDWLSVYISQKGSHPRNAQELIAFVRHRGGTLLYRDARRSVAQASGLASEVTKSSTRTDHMTLEHAVRQAGRASDPTRENEPCRSRISGDTTSLQRAGTLLESSPQLRSSGSRASLRGHSERRERLRVVDRTDSRERDEHLNTGFGADDLHGDMCAVEDRLQRRVGELEQTVREERAHRLSLANDLGSMLASDERRRQHVDNLLASISAENRALAAKWEDFVESQSVSKSPFSARLGPSSGRGLSFDDDVSFGPRETHDTSDVEARATRELRELRGEVRAEFVRLEQLTSAVSQKLARLLSYTRDVQEMRVTLVRDTTSMTKTLELSEETTNILASSVQSLADRLNHMESVTKIFCSPDFIDQVTRLLSDKRDRRTCPTARTEKVIGSLRSASEAPPEDRKTSEPLECAVQLPCLKRTDPRRFSFSAGSQAQVSSNGAVVSPSRVQVLHRSASSQSTLTERPHDADVAATGETCISRLPKAPATSSEVGFCS